MQPVDLFLNVLILFHLFSLFQIEGKLKNKNKNQHVDLQYFLWRYLKEAQSPWYKGSTSP